MSQIRLVTVEVEDAGATQALHRALGVDDSVRSRPAAAESSGFRGFALSLVVPHPSDVRSLVDAATDVGAAALKPPAKSLWGYGAVLRSPGGTVWTLASATKKDAAPAPTPPAERQDELVLQLGVADVAASKQFYLDQGFSVAKSYGRKYVEFTTGAITLTLSKVSGLAKSVGLSAGGTGSHRLVVHGDGTEFTDPDGFVWEAVREAP